jgi:hypothetical protein
MSRRGPYRCRPCSERTGQVVYRLGHKRPVQAAHVPHIPSDYPWDFSAVSSVQVPPRDVSLPTSGLTEFTFPTPVIGGGVGFGEISSFSPAVTVSDNIPDTYGPGGQPSSNEVGFLIGQGNLPATDSLQLGFPPINSVYDGMFNFVSVSGSGRLCLY